MTDCRDILRSAQLPAPHGFFTGIGHDGAPDPARIVPQGQLVLAKQVHSALALAVDAPFAPDCLPEVDALVTATPGLVLGIVTADCAPVLLSDAAGKVVGAAHAGWRGAHGGVLEAAVETMVALGAERGAISAAIGPTIAQASYEVDHSFRDRFLADDPNTDTLFSGGKAGRFQFDLPGYVARRLARAGVGAVIDLAQDTYPQPTLFHSFRRATHLGEPTYGRQFSLIGLAC